MRTYQVTNSNDHKVKDARKCLIMPDTQLHADTCSARCVQTMIRMLLYVDACVKKIASYDLISFAEARKTEQGSDDAIDDIVTL